MALKKPGVIVLFDVDGTLTAPRKVVTLNMLQFMKELGKAVTIGVVGGSDLVKISEQLGQTVTTDYDYVFAENGLVAYKEGKLIGTQSLKTFLGEDNLKEFINFTQFGHIIAFKFYIRSMVLCVANIHQRIDQVIKITFRITTYADQQWCHFSARSLDTLTSHFLSEDKLAFDVFVPSRLGQDLLLEIS